MKEGIATLLLSLGLFISSIPSGAEVDKLPLYERVNRSDLIVIGTVINKESRWHKDKARSIRTYVTISPKEYIKGWSQLRELTIVLPGGVIEEEHIEQHIFQDIPQFAIGEEVLVMLRALPESVDYAVVNSIYGKFTFLKDGRKTGEDQTKKDLINKIKAAMAGHQVK